MKRFILVLLVSLFQTGLSNADDGLVTLPSNYSVAETLDRFEAAVIGKGMTVFARIDHGAGAGKVGKTLRPTVLLIFGNPKVGTLLMQSNQTAGLDLPMKVLAWEDEQGRVWLTYNAASYLAARHGITGRDEVVEKMTAALANFAGQASAQPE